MCMCIGWEEHEQAVVGDGTAHHCAQLLERMHDGLALLVGRGWRKCEQLLGMGGQVAPFWMLHCV